MNRRSVPMAIATLACSLIAADPPLHAQSDLDTLMRQVIEARDNNWTKLQQYVLDERERIELRGPAGATLWGERRDYTWFLRDGLFIRSPIRVNGVAVGEPDRRAFERSFVEREAERERRRTAGAAERGADDVAPQEASPSTDVETLIGQNRQPQFVSTAYFLRFRFESGRYAFVGRETVEGREALKVEYYPTMLFRDSERRRAEPRRDDPVDREARRLMNRVSLVTLWIEPTARQVLKYTFENMGLDFLPSQWFARVSDVKASMTMGEPFPDVWLPKTIDVSLSGMLAVGQFDMHYGVEYHDYRKAEVGSKVVIPTDR